MTRRPLDAYYTPDALASALVGTLAGTHGLRGSVLEPHAGDGAFVRALEALGLTVCPLDIDPDAKGIDHPNGVVGDFLEYELPTSSPDWIVGNPPFSQAEQHIRHALKTARVGVAFLLRLAMLESGKRVQFWAEHPASAVYVLAQRPSFTGGGTDSAAYALFVWDQLDNPYRNYRPTTLDVLSWR